MKNDNITSAPPASNDNDKGKYTPNPSMSQGQSSGDILSDIKSEIESAKNEIHFGVLVAKTANQTVTDALKLPEPVSLYDHLWYEGETCCLFADSNVGKSVFAVQMADTIARTRKVLYVDFELSEIQFQKRYYDRIAKEGHIFSDNFVRVSIDPAMITDVDDDFESNILNYIEGMANIVGAKVVIIDNLTYLCNNSEKGEDAGSFMIRLLNLKKKYGWSLLVIAHTPKRDLSRPITQNDLAGSKKLFNLFDSAFTIGQSAKDKSLRYVKQMKVRVEGFTYTSDNVAVYSLTDSDMWLHFEFTGYGVESEHLQTWEKNDKVLRALELRNQGLSYAKIGEALSISPTTAMNYVKKFMDGSKPEKSDTGTSAGAETIHPKPDIGRNEQNGCDTGDAGGSPDGTLPITFERKPMHD